MNCYGCFKVQDGQQDFCSDCQKMLFKNQSMPALLPFSLEQYHEKLNGQVQKNSIGGYQRKAYLSLQSKKLALANWAKSQYVLKPVPDDSYCFKDDAPANEHLTMQNIQTDFRLAHSGERPDETRK